MRVQDIQTILNYLYNEDAHRLSSIQHEALGQALLILRTLPPATVENCDTVLNGLRFVQEPK